MERFLPRTVVVVLLCTAPLLATALALFVSLALGVVEYVEFLGDDLLPWIEDL